MILPRLEIADLLWDNLALIVVDKQGVVAGANPAAEAAFRCSVRGGMVGMVVEELMPAKYQKDHKDYRDGYWRNPHHRLMGTIPLQGQRMDGDVFPAEIMLIPAMVTGVSCVVAVIFDMTGKPTPAAPQVVK